MDSEQFKKNQLLLSQKRLQSIKEKHEQNEFRKSINKTPVTKDDEKKQRKSKPLTAEELEEQNALIKQQQMYDLIQVENQSYHMFKEIDEEQMAKGHVQSLKCDRME